jgi:dsRNA-specific ribonuclease
MLVLLPLLLSISAFAHTLSAMLVLLPLLLDFDRVVLADLQERNAGGMLLANVFEAFAGALFLDQGPEVVREKLVVPLMQVW